MNLINKTEINEFISINMMVAHWGVLMEYGEVFKVTNGGKSKDKIYFDMDGYLAETIPIPSYDYNVKSDDPAFEGVMKKLGEDMDVYEDKMSIIRKKWKTEIEYNWITLKGETYKNEYSFIFETEDELKEKYGLDVSKRLCFNHTVYYFKEYFDLTQFNRAIKIEDILG